MRTIEVSDENYAALEDRLDPDIKTHDDVISGLFDFADAMIEQNHKQKERLRVLEAERDDVARRLIKLSTTEVTP